MASGITAGKGERIVLERSDPPHLPLIWLPWRYLYVHRLPQPRPSHTRLHACASVTLGRPAPNSQLSEGGVVVEDTSRKTADLVVVEPAARTHTVNQPFARCTATCIDSLHLQFNEGGVVVEDSSRKTADLVLVEPAAHVQLDQPPPAPHTKTPVSAYRIVRAVLWSKTPAGRLLIWLE